MKHFWNTNVTEVHTSLTEVKAFVTTLKSTLTTEYSNIAQIAALKFVQNDDEIILE